jgi:hypothetical protein
MNRTIEETLAAIYDDFYDHDATPAAQKRKRDFVFHMTDWVDDLERLAALYRIPGDVHTDDAREIVMGFLFHAIPHLRAAGRLLVQEIPDAFERNTAVDIRNSVPSKSKRRSKSRARKPPTKVA